LDAIAINCWKRLARSGGVDAVLLAVNGHVSNLPQRQQQLQTGVIHVIEPVAVNFQVARAFHFQKKNTE
jgi:hypothetical protein